MGTDSIEYGVRLNRVFVIDLIAVPCFFVNMEFLNHIHGFTFFFGCVEYCHNLIYRPHRVIVVK